MEPETDRTKPKRRYINLSSDLYDRVADEAQRRGIQPTTFIQAAIDAALPPPARKETRT